MGRSVAQRDRLVLVLDNIETMITDPAGEKVKERRKKPNYKPDALELQKGQIEKKHKIAE